MIQVDDDVPMPKEGAGKGNSAKTLLSNALRGLQVGQSIALNTAGDYAKAINCRVLATRKDSASYGKRYVINKNKENPEQYRIWRTK